MNTAETLPATDKLGFNLQSTGDDEFTGQRTKLKVDKEAIINELRYQRDKGVSTKQMESRAKLNNIQISYASFNNAINAVSGHHKDVSELMWQKLEAYVLYSRNNTAWKIYDTDNYQLVQMACKNAKREMNMVMVHGETGLGKTTALKSFANRVDDVYYVHMHKTKGMRDCLLAIAEAIGVKDTSGTLNRLFETITTRLNKIGGLLILDDCGKVMPKFHGLLLQIFASTEGNVGIVVAGVDEMLHWLLSNRGKVEGIKELIRRFSYRQPLSEPSKDIIAIICKEYGITNDKSIKYVQRQIHNYGELKNVCMIAKRTDMDGSLLTPEALRELVEGKISINPQD